MSKILKNCNDKKSKLDSVYKPNGTLTETPDETLEITEKSHFKDGDPPAHTNTSLDIRCIPLFAREARVRRRRKIFCDKWYATYINTSPDKHLSQIIYSESRMQEAISSFDPAGPDILQPLVYKIPYRRAPRLACRLHRPSASREQRYLAYNATPN